MNKKYTISIVSIVAAAGIIWGSHYLIQKKAAVAENYVEIPTETSTATSTTSAPTVTPKVSLLANNAYVDKEVKFSVYLPKGWTKVTNNSGTSTIARAYFTNGSSTIAVKRFERTSASEKAIAFMGVDEFLVFIADGLKDEIAGYKVVATSTVEIQGVKYYKVIGNYTGGQTQKPVTQYVYVGLMPDSYYVIGADAYSDVWPLHKDAILSSISTIKLLQ